MSKIVDVFTDIPWQKGKPDIKANKCIPARVTETRVGTQPTSPPLLQSLTEANKLLQIAIILLSERTKKLNEKTTN